MKPFHLFLAAMTLLSSGTCHAASAFTMRPSAVKQGVESAVSVPGPLVEVPAGHKADCRNDLMWQTDMTPSSISFPRSLMRQVSVRKTAVKAPASADAAGLPDLQGCVSYLDSWVQTQEPQIGIYSISSSGLTPRFIDDRMLTSYGQVYAGDKYFVAVPETYANYVVDMTYHIYDTRDWSVTSVQGDLDFKARAMAFDPMSRYAYVITENYDEATYQFSRMDMDTYKWTVVRDFGRSVDWSALMCSPDGVVYGITKPGMLVKFDKTTGTYEEIGLLGITSARMTSATIDPATGRCFYVCLGSDETSQLYEIDLAEGNATFLFNLVESPQILSLFVPQTPAAGAAPAAATDVTLAFDVESRKGSVRFTAPALTVAGEPLSGELAYTVKVNTASVAEGNIAAGASAEAEFDIAASGEYTACVTFSNAAGEGEAAYATAWLGNDRPAVPANVKVAEVAGKLHVSWDAVTKGTMGGYFDPAAVTYTVTAYPEGREIQSSVSDTFIDVDVPQPDTMTRYSFGVVAVLGDSRSQEARSNNYVAGVLSAPFYEDFSSPDAMDLFTVINVNGDRSTWEYFNFAGDPRLKCEYNTTADMDDWVVLWPVMLEADRRYVIGCDAKATDGYVEALEIKVARTPSLGGLEAGHTVVAPSDVKNTDYAPFTGEFVPAVTGLYYVGIHGISKKNMNKLYVDNVRISEGVSLKAPAAVTDIRVTPDPDGKLSATLSCKAPTLNLLGDPVGSISYILIEREGVEVGRVSSPAPGATVSLTDNAAVNGINNYTFTAVNSFGRGESKTMGYFVGVVAPFEPENVNVCRGGDTGEALVTWDPSTMDEDGHELNSSNVTYTVLRSFNNSPAKVVATGLSECRLLDRVVEPDAGQGFVYYGVKAVTAGGESFVTALSNIYPLGSPYKTPARESFRASGTDGIWTAEQLPDSYTVWDIYDSVELPFGTFDGDGVAAAFSMYAGVTNKAPLYSGLFDLSGLASPVLTFYLYDIKSANSLAVSVNDGKEWKKAADISFGEKDYAWRKVTVDLSAYAGKVVCFELMADNKEINICAVDNLRVTDDVDRNLSALSLSAPEKAAFNEPFTIAVSYENSGKLDAEEHTVELYRDGEKIAEKACGKIGPSTKSEVRFNVTLPVVSAPAPEFKGVIRYAADQCVADNETAPVAVKFEAPTLPAPERLTAAQADREVELAWDGPDMSKTPITTSKDDVESYVAFSNGLETSVVPGDYMGEWTVYDCDGLKTYIPSTMDEPYPNGGEEMAFMVYNGYEAGEDLMFASHSGHQMFLCMAGKPTETVKGNDDWLVSPRLAGVAQTISFYANSITSYGADTFQVLYSTTGKAIEDFTLLETVECQAEWHEYEFSLPEGAVYFAIRCISEDKYAFMVDDFTMITEHDVVSDLELKGYNVYCDGVCVNDELLSARSFTHKDVANGKHSYQVAALYNRGESIPSNVAEVDFYVESGIAEAGTDSGVKILAVEGAVVVAGASGETVTVCDPAGHTLHSVRAKTDRVTIPMAAGIYVVKAGAAVAKVAVR